MFFEQPNLVFDIKSIFLENTPPTFIPIKKNLQNRIQHKMEISVCGKDVKILVDDIPYSFSEFVLNDAADGYISLVSNAFETTEGAFISFELYEESHQILKLNFKDLSNADELENWFDSYYFSELNGKKAHRTAISDFWEITNDGRLRCIKKECGTDDISEFCLLTLTKRSFKNFKAIIIFEQCGYRYGLSFGCPIAQFPYYRDPQTMTIKVLSGAFAYIEQESFRNLRGNIPKWTATHPNYYIKKYNTPLETFYSQQRNISFSMPRHTLIFHISSDATYYFKNKVIFAKSGNVTYVPPNTPFYSEYSVDKHIVVSFNLLSDTTFEAESYIPTNPSEFDFLFNKMLKTYHIHNNMYHYECTYNLYKIYALILKEKIATTPKRTSLMLNLPAELQPAFEFLDKNFTNPNIKIPDLAKVCHISETQFRKLFNKHTGTSPQKYIQQMRIDFAIFLLDSKYYKIYEVAEKSGFPNTKYFSTVFKEIMNVSPTQWLESRTSTLL